MSGLDYLDEQGGPDICEDDEHEWSEPTDDGLLRSMECRRCGTIYVETSPSWETMTKNGAGLEYDLMPDTAEEALRRWDAGESVFTVEMGGLGPGYEQCIHILAFEVIRDHLASGEELPPDGDEAWRDWGDAAVSRLNPDIGFSGAQVGAALNLAARTLKVGWRTALDEVGSDRHIQVSRKMPNAPANA